VAVGPGKPRFPGGKIAEQQMDDQQKGGNVVKEYPADLVARRELDVQGPRTADADAGQKEDPKDN